MNDKKRLTHKEEGQALVLVAAAILGLLAFLGLAVDGGNVYLQRRNAQNAADAGAQAGTVALAQNAALPKDKRTLTGAQLCDIIRDYATVRNETDPDLLTFSYSYRSTAIQCNDSPVPDRPVGAGVSVQTGIEVDSFVSQIIGRDSFRVAAPSGMQWGPPASMPGGLHPIAVFDDWLEGKVDKDGKKINPAQPKYDPNNPNDPMWDGPARGDTDATVFTFWDDDKGATADPNSVYGGNRGWLNLNCKMNRDHAGETCNSSNQDDKEWMRTGYDDGVIVGDQLKGNSGTRASSIKVAEDRIKAGDYILNLPVYHNTGADNGKGAKAWYEVVGFVTLRMTEANSGGNDKYIRGYFVNYTTLGEIGGEGTDWFGNIVIQQTK